MLGSDVPLHVEVEFNSEKGLAKSVSLALVRRLKIGLAIRTFVLRISPSGILGERGDLARRLADRAHKFG